MRHDLLELIRCPLCQASDLSVEEQVRDEREIRSGAVVCGGCGGRHEIDKGIVDLMPAPSVTIESERRGWVEMLGQTSDAMIADMLRLPYLESAIWITTAENFDQAIAEIDPAGKTVLDIGAGRCWSSRHLAARGARTVVAVDVLRERFIGLETADLYLEHEEDLYFERIVGDMNALPVRSGIFDIVFMTGTLHHSSTPEQAMREAARALAPGGLAVVINEPVESLLRRGTLEGNPELAHGINENIYSLGRYQRATRRAGLRSRLLFPRSVAARLERGDHDHVLQELGSVGYRLVARLARSDGGRRMLNGSLLPAIYRVASMPLVMLAHKPVS